MKKLFKIEDILSHIPKRQIENEVWANPSRDWVILLFSFFILFTLVFGYSMYRFYVWQNIEEYLPATKADNIRFERAKAIEVREDFLEREQTAKDISPSATSYSADTTEGEEGSKEEGADSTAPGSSGTVREE